MPAEQKKWVYEAIDELYDYIFETQEKLNADRLEEIKQKKPDIKIIHFTQEQQQAFRQYSLKLRKRYIEMAGEQGKEILNQFLQEDMSSKNFGLNSSIAVLLCTIVIFWAFLKNTF